MYNSFSFSIFELQRATRGDVREITGLISPSLSKQGYCSRIFRYDSKISPLIADNAVLHSFLNSKNCLLPYYLIILLSLSLSLLLLLLPIILHRLLIKIIITIIIIIVIIITLL